MKTTYDYFVDHVYWVLKTDCADLDAIYSDHIQEMVGVYGLNALLVNNLLESCGKVNGRQLYVLCKKHETVK